MNFLLSWVINSKGDHTYSFDWAFLSDLLNSLKNCKGSITLSMIDKNLGIISLQVQAENNNYLLTAEDENEDEIDVKSYFNKSRKKGKIEILGEEWDISQITNDYSLILNSFFEYFSTGDLKKDYIM